MRLIPFLLAALSLLAQSPGRKYTTVQRIERERLEAVHEARLRFEKNRKAIPGRGVFEDYRAILHLHAEDAPHTGGKREEVLRGAKETGVRIVIFSDHDGPKPETWRGMRDGVLFVPGAEFSAKHLLVMSFQEGPLSVLSHVEEVLDAPATDLAGMEIYNRHTDATDEAEFNRYFQAAMKNPAEWAKISANLAAFPDEFFGAGCDYWPSILARFDREIQKHHFTGIAANDGHHNQIYQGVDFDPYERSFRNVSTHILARSLTEADVREALVSGRAYVSHDWLADPAGFAFVAGNNLGVFDMGDSVPALGGTRLTALLPIEARLKLFRNGVVLEESTGSALNFTAKEPGAYRIEAWLPVDGEERPWIYSNPIYLVAAGLETVKMPGTDISPTVEVVKDITYTSGKPGDEAKHKLDLYLPKGKKGFPVFFFIHGGSWRSGDRSRYVALGNRFAKDGIGTVVISYRLAPQNPHPAQIEDAAAAFAWTVRNIERYGGRRDRIFVGGHSAGGHLTALLTLAPQYLKAQGLSSKDIRGAIPMSGVYVIQGLDSVFGTNPEGKKEASPITYVTPGAPPFLITYCQWDYPSLPAQARLFDAALRKAGVSSELVYVPKQNHISEIVNVVESNDVTARAVLEFIRR